MTIALLFGTELFQGIHQLKCPALVFFFLPSLSSSVRSFVNEASSLIGLLPPQSQKIIITAIVFILYFVFLLLETYTVIALTSGTDTFFQQRKRSMRSRKRDQIKATKHSQYIKGWYYRDLNNFKQH